MAFDEIDSCGIAAYVERHRCKSSPWGFLHIPKTAGTSLVAELAAQCPPYYNIHIKDYSGSHVEIRLREWQAVQEFVDIDGALPAGEKHRSCSGHLRREHEELLRQRIDGIRFFTFLREPVDRVVSDYRYCLTPRHPPHLAFAAQFPTLWDYALHPMSQNTMAKRLASDWSQDAATVSRSALDHFEFIGIVEMYQMSASIVFAMMGLIHRSETRLNETERTPRNSIDVSAELRDKIRQINFLDETLYRQVQNTLASQRAGWEEYYKVLQRG